MEQKYKISYKKAVFIVMVIAVPMSQIGFKNLIKVLYPGFGAVSVIFMVRCMWFYMKNRS